MKKYNSNYIYTFIGPADLEAKVYYLYYPGRPAKTYGPMEDCYPEEGAEVDISHAVIGKLRLGPTHLWIADDMERLEELCHEDAQDKLECAADSQAEYEYEIRRERNENSDI